MPAIADIPLISTATSDKMRALMRRNVAEQAGTGKRAEVRGYQVGGKTGTAEMPGVGGYREKAVISSFLAAFPMDNPRYLVFVLLFEPKGTQETGGEVLASRNAAPTAGRVISRIGPLLGMLPTQAAAAGATGMAFDASAPQNMKLGDVAHLRHEATNFAIRTLRRTMLLSSLIGADAAAPAGSGNVEVAGITADSRNVRPGFVFAAIPGTKADGARFIADAVAKGAAAILDRRGHRGRRYRRRAGAARRRAAPRAGADGGALLRAQQPQTMVAVTGTSGKTSVADFTRQIFAALGHKSASLGTIGLVKPDGAVYGSLTTPDPVALHKTLAELAAEGVTHLAFEASSHGLDQHRLDGVRLKAAAFTNLGRDHLDYHPTMEAYLAAKLRLFSELLPADGTAVINADARRRARGGQRGARRRAAASSPSGAPAKRLKLERLVRDGFAQRMSRRARRPRVRHPPAAARRLPGVERARRRRPRHRHRRVAGRVLPALQGLKGVKGRLEIVGEARGGLAVVDYAHKPEALAAVLDALRPFATGRLICVFGCGGDRDKGKRPIMGAHRRREGGRRHRHRRQPAHRAAGGDPRRNPHRRSGRARDRRPGRGDRRRRRPCSARAMCCSSPARATRPGRSSATRCCRSRTTTKCARHWSAAEA